MLGIPTYDQGSVAAGAHAVARTFLSGLAAELPTVVPPTTGDTDRVKEFDEKLFGFWLFFFLNQGCITKDTKKHTYTKLTQCRVEKHATE
jgi:hypothetical protein